MRLIPFTVLWIAAFWTLHAGASDSVLLASSRAGWLEAMSLDNLSTVARLRVPGMTETVASNETGRRLF
jgi:hypothetical protein